MSERTDRINELARKQKTVGLTPEEEAEQKKLREEFRAAFRANFQKQLDNTYIETPDGEKRKLKKKNKIMRKRPHSGRFLFCAPELRFCTHKQIFRPQCTSFSSSMLLYKEKRGKIRHRKAWASGLLQSAVGRAFPLPFAKNAQNRLT